MTIERVLEYNGKKDFYNLQQIQFAETDCTSETTDMDVSKKLVDNEGNIVMLIEALTMDYYSNDDLYATKGCFIKRFEFTKDIINSRPWFDFIVSFTTLTPATSKMLFSTDSIVIGRSCFLIFLRI